MPGAVQERVAVSRHVPGYVGLRIRLRGGSAFGSPCEVTRLML
jgi:hypothetical protein